MEGLELIQNRILEQANEKAAEISGSASVHREEILNAARQECQQIKAATELKTNAQVEAILNRARSMAAMESRKNELQKRQQLIDQVIEKALLKVSSMTADMKLDLYTDMINELGFNSGEIRLAAVDANLADALLARLGKGFSVSSTDGNFSGGLILGRGNIEDNLTFDLIVRNQRPQLSAVAAKALPQNVFEGGKEQN